MAEALDDAVARAEGFSDAIRIDVDDEVVLRRPYGLADRAHRPRSHAEKGPLRYGLGFWLAPEGRGVVLEGYGAGVSFRSMHDPERRVTWTVVSNTSDDAWPIARALAEQLGP